MFFVKFAALLLLLMGGAALMVLPITAGVVYTIEQGTLVPMVIFVVGLPTLLGLGVMAVAMYLLFKLEPS